MREASSNGVTKKTNNYITNKEKGTSEAATA
jgi:hypothetical protein